MEKGLKGPYSASQRIRVYRRSPGKESHLYLGGGGRFQKQRMGSKYVLEVELSGG